MKLQQSKTNGYTEMTHESSRRHDPGKRNLDKASRQIGRVARELQHIRDTLTRLDVNLRYAIKKAAKLQNRLRSERMKPEQ